MVWCGVVLFVVVAGSVVLLHVAAACLNFHHFDFHTRRGDIIICDSHSLHSRIPHADNIMC